MLGVRRKSLYHHTKSIDLRTGNWSQGLVLLQMECWCCVGVGVSVDMGVGVDV